MASSQINHPPPPRSRRLGCPLAAVLIVFILVCAALFLLWRCEQLPRLLGRSSVAALEQVGRDARDQFVRLARLQPRVTVNNRVYLEQTAAVAQLAVVERRVEVEHEMMHSWAGSTKRIRLHGTYQVKAGFDLGKPFSVNVTPGDVVVALPHAEILSVEQEKIDVLTLENGFWNRISPNDIEHELALLPGLAREKCADLPAQAETLFTRQLLEKFHPRQPVRTVFPASTPAR